MVGSARRSVMLARRIGRSQPLPGTQPVSSLVMSKARASDEWTNRAIQVAATAQVSAGTIGAQHIALKASLRGDSSLADRPPQTTLQIGIV